MKYGANTDQWLQKNNKKYSQRTRHSCKNQIKPVWNITGTKKKQNSRSYLEKKTKRRSAYWQTSPHQVQLLQFAFLCILLTNQRIEAKLILKYKIQG